MKFPAQLITFFAGILLAVTVNAQTYPVKPILMIVPLQAGSAGDVMMRIVAQKMSENLGQQIVIDNQAGAAGLIGAERIARASPDGYTIGGISDSVLNFAPNLRSGCARIRVQHLGRDICAARHAQADHRAAERGNNQGNGRSFGTRTAAGPGHGSRQFHS